MIRLSLVLLLFAPACNVSDEGRSPPADGFFYPTGIAVDPRGDWLFVTNGNTDLRYNGGSVVAVKLSADDGTGILDQYLTGACTGRDPIDNRTAVCDQSQAIDSSRTVALGSFAGQPVVQRFFRPRTDLSGQPSGILRGTGDPCNPDPPAPAVRDVNCVPLLDPDPELGYRLLVPVRGDPSLTWINVSKDGELDCGQGAGPVGRCDATHRLTVVATTPPGDPQVTLAPEPFEVALSEPLGVAMTAHLTSAVVALFDIGDGPGVMPELVDQRPGAFSLNGNGVRGAFGIAFRPTDGATLPTVCEGLPACPLGDFTYAFVTSRFSPRVGLLLARGSDQCRPQMTDDPCAQGRALAIVAGPQIPLDALLIDGSDARDVKFTRDGNRAYVVDRRPPSLLEIDTTASPPPSGPPADILLRAIEVCQDPSYIALREDPPPLRAYVTCFAAGQIFVVDPAREAVVEVIQVGRGPNALVQLPPQSRHGALGALGVVANFADNDLSVLDLQPGSPTENTVLFKIGAPRPITENQ